MLSTLIPEEFRPILSVAGIELPEKQVERMSELSALFGQLAQRFEQSDPHIARAAAAHEADARIGDLVALAVRTSSVPEQRELSRAFAEQCRGLQKFCQDSTQINLAGWGSFFLELGAIVAVIAKFLFAMGIFIVAGFIAFKKGPAALQALKRILESVKATKWRIADDIRSLDIGGPRLQAAGGPGRFTGATKMNNEIVPPPRGSGGLWSIGHKSDLGVSEAATRQLREAVDDLGYNWGRIDKEHIAYVKERADELDDISRKLVSDMGPFSKLHKPDSNTARQTLLRAQWDLGDLADIINRGELPSVGKDVIAEMAGNFRRAAAVIRSEFRDI